RLSPHGQPERIRGRRLGCWPALPARVIAVRRSGPRPCERPPPPWLESPCRCPVKRSTPGYRRAGRGTVNRVAGLLGRVVRRAYLSETDLSNLPSSPQAREDLAGRFQGELSGYSTSMLNLFLPRSRVTVNFSGVDSSFWYFGWIGERRGLPSSG